MKTLHSIAKRAVLRGTRAGFSMQKVSSLKAAERSLAEVIGSEYSEHLEELREREPIAKMPNWLCESNLKSTKVVLYSKEQNTRVIVVFNAKTAQPMGVREELMLESGSNLEPGVEFLLIVDPLKTQSVVFTGRTSGGDMALESTGFILSKNIQRLINQPSLVHRRSICCSSPLQTISDATMKHFENYLSNLGVDHRLATFIEEKSQLHELNLYQNWLKNLYIALD